MIKKIKIITILLLFPLFLFSQSFPGYFCVRFTDKNNSAYTISNPSAYLSARAITRRTQQGIPIVTNDLPVNPAYINGILATGATLHGTSKWFNSVTVFVTSDSVLQQIIALPYVAQTDFTKPGAKSQPKNPMDKGKWAYPTFGEPLKKINLPTHSHQVKSTLFTDYGMGFNQVHQIKVDALHSLGFRGDGVIIAVLDGGFSHADSLAVFDSLWINGQILATHDFVSPGSPDLYGSASHGTNVLSIMGGNLPGQLVGTAPKASYFLLRSEDVGTEYKIEEDNWASAAEFADSAGADIINSSLGYSVFWDNTMDYSYSEMDGNTARSTIAADFAASKGIVVCISAGNSGGSLWQYVSAPADADSVLTIGAVDEFGSYANFSSTGPTADGRLKPNVCGQGKGTVVASTYGGIFPGNGTSFSSPVIAGAAACLRQAFPQMTNMQLQKAIEQSADHYANPDSLYGYGIPDFSIANLILQASIPPSLDAGLEPRIVPNPAHDNIRISFATSDIQDVNVSLLDMQGRKVMTEQSFEGLYGPTNLLVQLPVNLANGLYFLRIATGKKIFLTKLVKI